MKCPSCIETTVLSMTERNGIEIDYCPVCRGVWLDRGELDKIIAKTHLEKMYSEPLPREKIQEVIYRDEHFHKNGFNKNKRKKSFFEELFD